MCEAADGIADHVANSSIRDANRRSDCIESNLSPTSDNVSYVRFEVAETAKIRQSFAALIHELRHPRPAKIVRVSSD